MQLPDSNFASMWHFDSKCQHTPFSETLGFADFRVGHVVRATCLTRNYVPCMPSPWIRCKDELDMAITKVWCMCVCHFRIHDANHQFSGISLKNWTTNTPGSKFGLPIGKGLFWVLKAKLQSTTRSALQAESRPHIDDPAMPSTAANHTRPYASRRSSTSK